MKSDLTSLEHLRRTALETRALAAEVAGAAAEAIQEVAAGLPVRRAVTLAVGSWTGTGPYTQTVAVEGVRADEAGQLVQIAPASASLEAWSGAGVRCTAQGAGTLVFEAKEKPAGDMSIFIVLQEVLG